MKSSIHDSHKKIRLLVLNTFILILGLITVQACDDDDDGPTDTDDAGNIVEVASSDDDFSDLVSALEDADLVTALEGDGPFTVFAPTNDAFAELPEGFIEDLSTEELTEILSYHVVESEVASTDLQTEQSVDGLDGGQLFITTNGDVVVNDTATVIDADIEASNGIIHAIDQVLLPDSYLDVAGIISKRYSLETLENAVSDAGLEFTLQNEGPFTVFAPDNEAFEDVDLSELSEEELQDVLAYHVISEEILSDDIETSTVETVNGATLEINVDDNGNVTLTDQAGNTSAVTAVDFQGTNGVVHIIDGVLSPSDDN